MWHLLLWGGGISLPAKRAGSCPTEEIPTDCAIPVNTESSFRLKQERESTVAKSCLPMGRATNSFPKAEPRSPPWGREASATGRHSTPRHREGRYPRPVSVPQCLGFSTASRHHLLLSSTLHHITVVMLNMGMSACFLHVPCVLLVFWEDGNRTDSSGVFSGLFSAVCSSGVGFWRALPY